MKYRNILALLSIYGLTSLAAEETLHETSFESQKHGAIESFQDANTTWTSKGRSEITKKYSKTGQQSLRIFGGEDNSIEITLNEKLQSLRGLSFSAERWTRKAPFKFRIEAMVNGNWQEVSKLDNLIAVGGKFDSQIVIKLPDEIISGLRFKCTAPDTAGILIDDLKFLKGEPENVTKIPAIATEPVRNILEQKDIWISGEENTHTFRIPAIITAMNGDLIAATDARRKNSADLKWVNDIDIVIKRSTDNGKTWTATETVIDYGGESVAKPASDASFILDRTTGEIFCFYNFMDQKKAKGVFRLHLQSSKDHGKTWSKPRDLTDEISTPDSINDFKFITSGRGIQTRDGELLHTLVNLKHGVYLFGSKDHGKTWYFKKTPVKPADESKVAELNDGTLMINSRVGKGSRYVHSSSDKGVTWSTIKDTNLVDPRCNAAFIRYTSVKDGYKKNRLLFCNASSFSGRRNLAIRISYDEGKTWTDGKVIDAGPSAYSSLTICKDGSIAVLYEPGYKAIRFARFTLEDLTDGKDKLSQPYKIQ